MATGKYLSLEEARKKGKLKEFAKAHPSKGDKRQFDDALEAMANSQHRKTKEKKKK